MPLLFLQYPRKFHIVNPHPSRFSSRLAQFHTYQVSRIMRQTQASALFLMLHMHNKNYLIHHPVWLLELI